MPIALGLDLGTTSISAVAVGEDGGLVAKTTKVHHADLKSLPTGHAEQSPAVILDAAIDALRDVGSKLREPPSCLGITGQMHGVVLIDEALQPLTNLITWQDKRSLELSAHGRSLARRVSRALRRSGYTSHRLHAIAGLSRGDALRTARSGTGSRRRAAFRRRRRLARCDAHFQCSDDRPHERCVNGRL